MPVFCITYFYKSASLKDITKHAFLKQSSLLPVLPLLSSHITSDFCGVRSYFKSWGTAKCVGVQVQVCVLGVRATELCVRLQQIADEAAEETWLAVSQPRFVRVFCVTRCSCWQGVTAGTSTQVMGPPEMWHRLSHLWQVVAKQRTRAPGELQSDNPSISHTHRRGSHRLVGFSLGCDFCHESSN